MEAPRTQYARSGDLNIAYQVFGDGPFDLVYIQGFAQNVELTWEVPRRAQWLHRLGEIARVIVFDKRGTGLSDAVHGVPTLEARMDDVRAVMDAAGSERAALFGVAEGGPMSALFAATYPQRTWALILYGTTPRFTWAPDFPWAPPAEEWAAAASEAERRWADPDWHEANLTRAAPSLPADERAAFARILRIGSTPRAVADLMRANAELDVRAILPTITVPTLVVRRSGDGRPEEARAYADAIPGARYAELPGADHIPFAGDTEALFETVRRFLDDCWKIHTEEPDEPERVLATVLFTDIVGSTAKAVELGDARWRELLREHHALVRRELTRFRGREIDTAGDGFFASFDGPARAIRCATAIAGGVRGLGLDVRAGLHTGECELIDGKIGGIAVVIGARIAAEARPGEVLVSGTVRDLVAGSGLGFEDRGVAMLKGIPDEWRLYRVAA